MRGQRRHFSPTASAPRWPGRKAVTLVSETHAPDDVYEETKKHFSEQEIVDLTLAVGMINLWNRLAISTRAVPGRYKPAQTATASGS
jgi:hypothetical protein